LRELGRDLIAHVARPTLGGIEGDDADGGRILAFRQMADQRVGVAIGRGGGADVLGRRLGSDAFAMKPAIGFGSP
jgi:hypothetical protein